jgi:spore germination protein YaaH
MIARLRLILSLLAPAILGVSIGALLVKIQLPQQFFSSSDPLSPLGQTWGVATPAERRPKEVVGFLPYWLVKDINTLPPVTEVVYFSLSLDNRGEIVTRQNPQEVDMGWYTLQMDSTQNLLAAFKRQGAQVTVAVTAFDNELIDDLTHRPEVKQRAIGTISEAVRTFGFNGVNIDFEYILNEPSASDSGPALVRFVKDLREQLRKENPQATVSVDLYVNGIIYDEPYDVAGLTQAADQVMVMAYDFHSPGSAQAGPVAPLRASGQDNSIVEGLEAALAKKVDLQKLVLGIPLYGYEWPTQSTEFKAPTLDTGVLATHKRIAKLTQTEDIKPMWDPETLSPWLWYESQEGIKQIYYDNDRSIGLKLQLVDQLGLQGIGFWALGYEGENQAIWRLVSSWQSK